MEYVNVHIHIPSLYTLNDGNPHDGIPIPDHDPISVPLHEGPIEKEYPKGLETMPPHHSVYYYPILPLLPDIPLHGVLLYGYCYRYDENHQVYM